jgi:hypothetical protein
MTGLDVLQDSIAVAHAAGGSAGPPVFVGAIGPRQADLDQLLRRLQGKTNALTLAYEAGLTAPTVVAAPQAPGPTRASGRADRPRCPLCRVGTLIVLAVLRP